MVSTAVKDLSEELFLGDSGLKELLEKSARAKLHPAVSAFIERVEIIVQAQDADKKQLSVARYFLDEKSGEGGDQNPETNDEKTYTPKIQTTAIHTKAPVVVTRTSTPPAKAQDVGNISRGVGSVRFAADNKTAHVSGGRGAAKNPAPAAPLSKPSETTVQTNAQLTPVAVRTAPPVQAQQPHFTARVSPVVPAVKNTVYYLSSLRDATKTLPQKRREAAESYLMRVLGADSADAIPESAERTALADDFIRLVKGGVSSGLLQHPFYAALGKFDGSDTGEIKKFQHAVRSSGGSLENTMITLAKYLDRGELYDIDGDSPANSPQNRTPIAGQTGCAPKIKPVADLYTEDPDMVNVIRNAEAFADDMAAARNSLVSAGADDAMIKNFYGAMKTIADYGLNRGSVYRDVLKLVNGSPLVGGLFLSWMAKGVSSMQDLDRELGKYTRIGPRFYGK